MNEDVRGVVWVLAMTVGVWLVVMAAAVVAALLGWTP